MEFIFELILDLILDSSIEASKNNKIPKYIRYPLILLIILFFTSVILLIFITGTLILKDNLIAGIFIIIIGLLMLILSIIKFKNTYIKKHTATISSINVK